MYSGYETLVKELSERLVKSGNEVTIYCHKKLFNKRPKKVNGINLVYTPSVNSKIFSQLYNSFFSFVHVCFSKSDVVLVLNSANAPFGLMTKLFGKKTCINVDGLEWLRPKWKGIGSLYFKISSKLSTYLFDQIITDSNEMSKIYEEIFKKKSSVIAYGPTMNKSYNKMILESFELVEKNYYLIVGRLIPDNNSKLIIEGFLSSNSNKKLVIVGDVPYKDKYAEKVKSFRSEKIILTGYISDADDLSCLYDNCYCYIHGHEFGGTNPTMINALYLNCQIIALNTRFNIEMLEDKEAILFEKNQKSIKGAINLLEKSYMDLLVQNNSHKLSKKYNWNFIKDQYLKIFFELTNFQNKSF